MEDPGSLNSFQGFLSVDYDLICSKNANRTIEATNVLVNSGKHINSVPIAVEMAAQISSNKRSLQEIEIEQRKKRENAQRQKETRQRAALQLKEGRVVHYNRPGRLNRLAKLAITHMESLL
jgi:hypothetical protein